MDEDFVRRLIEYLDAFPRGFKVMLLSFDFHYDDAGIKHEESSAFFVPDRYAAELARRFPDRCEWICSVHPARSDAVAALDWAAKQGARAVKWLPSAMGNRSSVGKIRWLLRSARTLESTPADAWR